MKNAVFAFGQSVDDIALLSDEEVQSCVKQLADRLDVSHTVSETKDLEIEISWYLREVQLRESRKALHEAYVKRNDILE